MMKRPSVSKLRSMGQSNRQILDFYHKMDVIDAKIIKKKKMIKERENKKIRRKSSSPFNFSMPRFSMPRLRL